MWIVYVHANCTNGKRYVGVTSKSALGRWERVLSDAHELQLLRKICSDPGTDHMMRARAEKRLVREAFKLEYDVAFGHHEFKHEELFRDQNLLKVLIREREIIAELNTRVPNGYNRSNGGEIPPYTNVVDVVRWMKELEAPVR